MRANLAACQQRSLSPGSAGYASKESSRDSSAGPIAQRTQALSPSTSAAANELFPSLCIAGPVGLGSAVNPLLDFHRLSKMLIDDESAVGAFKVLNKQRSDLTGPG